MSTTIIHLDSSDPTFRNNIAGASVSWELTDTIPHKQLVDSLTAAGIPNVPEACTASSALHRLMVQMYQDRHCLVKPVPNPVKGSKKPAYAVLPQKDEDGKLAFVQAWSVGIAVAEDGTEYLVFSDNTPEDVESEINMLYPAALEELGRTEQSIWLCNLVKNLLKGVPTIGGSGTFFIGPEEVKTWRALREVLAAYKVRLYEIPAMKSAQALECVVESVKRYTETAIAKLNEDLQKYSALQERIDGGEAGIRKIQDRVLKDRLEATYEQLQIVEKYETLFDMKLSELRTSLGNLQVGFQQLAISSQ